MTARPVLAADPVIPANRIPFGDGTSTPATNAQLAYSPSANAGLGEMTVNSVTSTSQVSGGLLMHGADAAGGNPAGGVYIFGGTDTVNALGGGGEAQVYGGSGRFAGGGFALAGGSALPGYGGTGGALALYSGAGDGAGANGIIDVSTPVGSGFHAEDAFFAISTSLGYQFSVLVDAGVPKIGVFTAVGAEVVQPVATTGLHKALSDLGWRVAGSPNDFALDYTNTATVGNVTIHKASGTVNMAAGATTLTLTNDRIAATSRVLVSFGSNPGVATSLYAVEAAGSCTINVLNSAGQSIKN